MLFKKPTVHSSDKEDSMRILSKDTPFSINEAFRTLYTNVLYLPIEDNCKKIVITSAVPGEGKTYVAINLAISLAQNGDNKKILVLDMDLRNSRMPFLVKDICEEDANCSVGASEYLAGITEDINIVKSKVNNLYFFFSGAESPNPIGLLNSKRLSKLIKEFENSYDYIIIDTPPVNLVSDALLLQNCVNGYIIASRADYSNINNITETIKSLKEINAEIYGFVLSDINPKKSGKGKKYSKYSKYSQYKYYEK